MTHVSPRTLAAAIGMSESSLKRWADEGRLTVERTAGGHRRIPLAAAVQFIRRSGLAVVRPELLELAAEAGGTMRAARDREVVGSQLYGALLDDRAVEARSLIVSLYVDGASLAWICDEVIRGALSRVGALWEHGSEGIFLEHRATETCLRALGEVRRLLPPVPGDAQVAVGGGFEEDEYDVPSVMAAMILTEAGYRARNLGARTPVMATLAAIAHYGPGLVWQSLSMEPRSPRDAARGLLEIATAVAPGSLVVGGRALGTVPLPAAANLHSLGSMAELAAFARGAVAARG
jgi:MerR family transcriptional regulator, light-induced transcriptional regulator